MNPNRPFDIDKLEFTKIRLAKRRKLLLFSMPVMIIIGLVALKFLSIGILAPVSANAYKDSQYQTSLTWLTPLTFVNTIEPYKVYHNRGNDYYKLQQFESAETEFRKALESVPSADECAVRVNLVMSIVAQADIKASAKDYDKAIVLYDNAKAVINDSQDGCGIQFNSSNNSETTNDTTKQSDEQKLSKDGSAEAMKQEKQNVDKKSDDAKKSRNGDKTDNKDNTDQQSQSDEPTQQQIEQLQQQQSESQQKRMKSQQSDREYNEYSQKTYDYTQKSW
jgi:tetratricopeptide (TPR) repeat protein